MRIWEGGLVHSWSTSRNALYLSLLLIAYGVVFLYGAVSLGQPFPRLTLFQFFQAASGITAFGGGVTLLTIRLFVSRGRPFVIVGKHGLVCRSPGQPLCRLPWSEIVLAPDSWRIYSLVGGKDELTSFPRAWLTADELGQIHRAAVRRCKYDLKSRAAAALDAWIVPSKPGRTIESPQRKEK